MIDLDAVDAGRLRDATVEDALEYLGSVPTEELNGFERFTHQFSHPQYWRFYLRAVLASFVWLLPATLTVTWVGERRIRTDRDLDK